jgi:hypothetical protein
MAGAWLGLIAFVALGDLDGYGSKYEVDLQHTKFDAEKLRLIGPGAGDFLKPGAEGMLATIPATAGKDAVGFGPRFRVSGDFSITASFIVQNFSAPQSGFGIGAHIYLLTEGDESVNIGRLQRVKEGHVYQASYATVGESGKRQQHPRFYPATGTSGKLRITRTDDTLHFFVAEDSLGDFRELRTVKFNLHDLKMVRFGVDHDGAQGAMEVLWTDIAIGADDLQGVGRVRRKLPTTWIAAGVLGGLPIIGGAVWWRIRRGRRLAPASDHVDLQIADQSPPQTARKSSQKTAAAPSAQTVTPQPRPGVPRAAAPGH